MSIVSEMKLDLAKLRDAGRRLAAIRVACDLSQLKLAARAKVPSHEICKFENGDYRRLSQAMRYRIAEALDVRYEDIFFGIDGEGAQ